MGHAILTALILMAVTLDNGKHYVKHCRKAPEGCEQRASDMATTFLAAGEEYNLSPLLLASVAYKETGFNPTRVGKRGERGLMQVLPSNLRPGDDKRDRFLILRATELLRGYVDWCDGSLNRGLGTYNAGMNLGKCPLNTIYTKRVLKKRRWFSWKAKQLGNG